MSVSRFFLTLVVILVGAKLGGELAERRGQPAVLGELLAGVLLGSSGFGWIPPDSEIFRLLSEVGICLLLLEVGLETDLGELLGVGLSAVLVAMIGVLLPFLLGWAVMIGLGTSSLVAIFTGATLTATSVGITARVLSDLGHLQTREAKIILGAAVADDILGLIILSAVSHLAVSGNISFAEIARTMLFSVGFIVGSLWLGRRTAPWLFGWVNRMQVRGILLVAAFSAAFLLAVLAHELGSAYIIGAFATGLVLSSVNQFEMIRREIKPVADIFTPIFFVTVGAAVDLRVLNPGHPQSRFILLAGGLLILAAVVGKVLSGYVIVDKKIDRLVIGIGMIPRGEVGLIFAQIGRSAHIFSGPLFSAITVMIMVTTFIVPPLLGYVLRRRSAVPATRSHAAED